MTDEKPADVAARAVRRLTSAILSARAHGAVDPDLAAEISELADLLDAEAVDAVDCISGKVGTHDGALERSPVSGPKNPVAIPLRFELDDDGNASAPAEFPAQYQGPAGFVHGGVSGLILDVAMAVANSGSNRPGMTAEMTLRYLRPVPLHREVTVRGRHLRADGRKMWARGTIEVDGEEAVVCDGLFISKELSL
ncbi:PaaI family thioesterase [Rhodococcus chondri]|uniref:Acyl-coenzyme A thioesterase THEM4 n=1 Tax=Rhodococcus chondri TaxID=3065941 RepID=A0ABU7JMM1_9NOCA|nr:PaaI family thioesterase [Rhodococcus sp. CC-R104]MEE2031292.1 PaaI family thioesterase [Rhodococcus sp. CC-R104]